MKKYNYATGPKGSVIQLEDGRYADTVHGDTSEAVEAHLALAVLMEETSADGWTCTEETLSDFTPAQLHAYVGMPTFTNSRQSNAGIYNTNPGKSRRVQG